MSVLKVTGYGVGGERRQRDECWSCAICLAEGGFFETAKAKAVRILYAVDKLQRGASGCWSNARASNQGKAKAGQLVGGNSVEFVVDDGASRSNEGETVGTGQG
jgi:hypothetical protein